MSIAPEKDDRAINLIRKVAQLMNPELDVEYMRYNAIQDRMWQLEKLIKSQAAQSSEKPKDRIPRAEQLAKERCQTVAKLLWQQNPNHTISELSVHPLIRDKEIAGGQFYEPRTVYDWIAEIKNHPQKNKRGRPRKVLKDNQGNLHS